MHGSEASRDHVEEPHVNQPGLRRLRQTVASFATKRIPSRRTFRREGVAGLTVTVSMVPDGMANGVLAGVNPIYGLYANMVAPIVGGLTSSTRLMVINSTSATALVAGQALIGTSADNRDGALFFMVILAGLVGLTLGVLGLGRLTWFVSFSVMTGFIAGIAVVLVLSQLSTVAGVDPEGSNQVARTASLLADLGAVHLSSLAMATLALGLALFLPRTPLSTVASLTAIAVPTIVALLAGFDGIRTVGDVGDISGGIPLPSLPPWSAINIETITGAMAVATVALVQGSGVSQSVPNADGSRSDSSRDFIAQGAANVASGLFRGLPVGGSLGGTALNLMAGTTGRLAGILSGVWMAVIVVVFPNVIARVVMPALGAFLILAAINSIDVADVRAVWRAGWPSRLAGATTFVSTLFLPIQVAVGFGVVLSALLYLNESSTDVSLVEMRARPDGSIGEVAAPKQLEGDRVTALDVYGHLFYAGARTLERILPSVPRDIEHPVVILRLRGRRTLGATLVDVLTTYADRLAEVGGRLYVTGVGEEALAHLKKTGRFKDAGSVRAYPASPVVLEATRQAYADAEAWLVTLHPDE